MKKFKIVVIAYGKAMTAVSDGTKDGTTITADESAMHIIRYSLDKGYSVDLTHSNTRASVVSGYDSPLALTAALFSVDEMRSIVWSAPKSVMKFIKNNMNTCSNFSIEDALGDS